MRTKYFYSPALEIRTMKILTDGSGNQVGVPSEKTTFKKRLPRVAVCSIYFPKENKLQFGTALCSAKDTFVKRKARELSFNRAYRIPEKVVMVKDRKKLKDISRRIANELIKFQLERFHAYVEPDF